MATDINLQAWLSIDAATHPPVVTPYIQSAQSQEVHYKILVVRKGRGGASQISQRGNVMVQPGLAAALSRFSVSVDEGDQCDIELVLVTSESSSKRYHFDCPK